MAKILKLDNKRMIVLGVKVKIHDIFFKFSITRKVYCLISNVKNRIIFGIKFAMPIYRYKKRCKHPIFLVFTPEHANLGDHAIAYAEQIMLKNNNIEYYEITGSTLYKLENAKFLSVMNGATILVNGGGNLGTLWPEIERMNRCLINENPNSRILIFPNSIFYEDNDYGRREFEKSIRMYNRHNNLTIYARESISYQIMKDKYRNVKLAPDMVLSLSEMNHNSKRQGCIICLRDDVEKTLNDGDFKKICSFAKNTFGGFVSFSNTVLEHNVSVSSRQKELQKKFNEFGSAELVITDRLHGMIFCAITETNCIVIDSKSPKMRGCYEWISNIGYIKFAENIDDISSVWDSIKTVENIFDNTCIIEAMKGLTNDILEISRNY